MLYVSAFDLDIISSAVDYYVVNSYNYRLCRPKLDGADDIRRTFERDMVNKRHLTYFRYHSIQH